MFSLIIVSFGNCPVVGCKFGARGLVSGKDIKVVSGKLSIPEILFLANK